jgi:beta-galactosidase
LKDAIKKAGLWGIDQQIEFPFITKSGINQQGKKVHYYFNYSATGNAVKYPYSEGIELLFNERIAQNEQMKIEAWGVKIVEEK